LEQQVVKMRERYPDWGARKLQVLLEREGLRLPRNTWAGLFALKVRSRTVADRMKTAQELRSLDSLSLMNRKIR
jgi:hypothetical protein